MQFDHDFHDKNINIKKILNKFLVENNNKIEDLPNLEQKPIQIETPMHCDCLQNHITYRKKHLVSLNPKVYFKI